MLQVVQNFSSGELEVAEVPAPVVRPGAVLLRTRASVVSAGTERHLVEMAQRSLLGKAWARPDLVRRVLDKAKADGWAETIQQVRQRLDAALPLGYSAAGHVAAVGEGVSGFREGDLVACGGQGVACHAEVLCAPPTLVARAPEGVSPEEAAFAMVGAIALHAVRLSRLQPGEWAAVVGLGLIGSLALQLLRAAGCRAIGLDVAPEKLSLGKALGAEAVVDSRSPGAAAAVVSATEGCGVDAVLIAAGSPGSGPIELASRISRVRGRIVATGLVDLNVPRHLFFERELDLVVSRGSGAGLFDPEYEAHGQDYPYPYVRWTHARNMGEFLRMVSSGAVKLQRLITHRFPIARAAEAYAALQGGSATTPIGIVLDYPAEAAVPASAVIRLRPKETAEGRPPRGAVRIGVIGAGLFARTILLPELKRIPGVRLAGVAAASGASALHAAKKFGFSYAAADARQILEDTDTDCVFILTRHDSHARLAAAALRMGKDVFVEKPLALTRDELQDVAAAQRESKARLMVGFNRRHSPHAAAAKEFLAGAAGAAMLHIRVNAGSVPPGSWVNDPRAGGDRVRGELCHFVDLAHYLLDGRATAVEAQALPPERAGEPAEDLIALLHFEGGSLASLFYTSRGHRALARERIEGYRGGRAAVIDNFRLTRFFGTAAPRARRTWSADRGHRGELSAWVRALREGGPAPVPIEAYVASTLATLAVAEALAALKRVDVDYQLLSPSSPSE